MPARPLCAYCRQRDVDDRFRPFCSQRCKTADLGRWLTGDYRLPGQPASGTAQTDLDASDEIVEDDPGR